MPDASVPLAVPRQDANLALILVHVDANMLHGWPPPLRHGPHNEFAGPIVPPREAGSAASSQLSNGGKVGEESLLCVINSLALYTFP
jgi:hypothetical protein